MQLRIGYYLTDQSEDGMGNRVMIPGTHNISGTLPGGVKADENDVDVVLDALEKARRRCTIHSRSTAKRSPVLSPMRHSAI
jgi:hypothetical protein